MQLVIKNPAPLGERLDKWGDYHFGNALAAALKAVRPDINIRQDYWPQWNERDAGDVVLVLRGKRRYDPPRAVPALLWVISHPSTVSRAEAASYTKVLAASKSFAAHLSRHGLERPAVLRQCTDTTRFSGPDNDRRQQAAERAGTIFVANSRGYRRDIVQWSLDAGHPPELVGGQWERVGLSHLAGRQSVSNEELPHVYRAARIGLNDHWADMRHFGIINNRILDCLACGLPVVTDRFPELEAEFGDALAYADDAASFQNAISRLHDDYPAALERARSVQPRIQAEYSFAARASQLLDVIDECGRAGTSPTKRTRADAEEWEAATGRYRGSTSLREILNRTTLTSGRPRILHLYPGENDVLSSVGADEMSYFSGGLGTGPWQLALDNALSQVSAMGFDLVFCESKRALCDIPPLARYGFLSGAVQSLSRSGVLVLPIDQAQGDWKSRVRHAGLRRSATIGRYAVLEPDTLGPQSVRVPDMVEYTRQLEFKLGAVYRSHTWRLIRSMARMRFAGTPRFSQSTRTNANEVPPRPRELRGTDPLRPWRPIN